MNRADMTSMVTLRKKAKVRGTFKMDVPLYFAELKKDKVLVINHEGVTAWVAIGDTYIAECTADVKGGADVTEQQYQTEAGHSIPD